MFVVFPPITRLFKSVTRPYSIAYHSLSDFTPHNDFFPSGSALLFLALSVTFELLSSTCADPVNFQNYTTVHLKGVKEVEVPKQVTNNRTSETRK